MLATLHHDPVFEQLSASPFGAELTVAECATLAAAMHAEACADGDYLIEEGTRNESLYVVTRGALAVIKRVGAHEERLALIGAGGLAGAMGFIDGQEHSANLRAVGPTQVLVLPRPELETLLSRSPQLVFKVLRVIIANAHHIVRRMNDEYVQLTSYIHRQNGRY